MSHKEKQGSCGHNHGHDHGMSHSDGWHKIRCGHGKTALIADATTLGGLPPEAFEQIANKGQPDGYAPLDGDNKVPIEHLPDGIGAGGTVTSVDEIAPDPATKNVQLRHVRSYTQYLEEKQSGTLPVGRIVVPDAPVKPPSGGRERLTANATLYVRQDGSDDNDGFTDSPGGALKTWGGALKRMSGIDSDRFNMSCKFGPGEWPGAEIPLLPISPKSRLFVEAIIPHQTYFAGQTTVRDGTYIYFTGIHFGRLNSAVKSYVRLSNCGVRGSGDDGITCHTNSFIEILGDLSFEGSFRYGIYAFRSGRIFAPAQTISFLDTPDINTFLASGDASSIEFAASISFIGSFVGRKWWGFNGGVIAPHTGESLNALIPGTTDGAHSGNAVFCGRIIAGRGGVFALCVLSNSSGLLNSTRSFGISSVSKLATGKYTVTLSTPYTMGGSLGGGAIAYPMGSDAGFTARVTDVTPTSVEVETKTDAGVLTDHPFTLIVL